MNVERILENSGWQFNEVDPQTVDYVWEKLGRWIEKAVRTGQGDETTSEWLRENVRFGQMKMWVVHKEGEIVGGMIFTLRQSRVLKMYIEVLAGDGMGEWFATLQDLGVDFARMVGADCVEASVRPGLAKFLKKAGWRSKATIMELSV